MPLDEVLPIARQIAEALEAAHEQDIIHRDLKPANIKVTPDGIVKGLDFGLAKLTQASGPQASELTASPTITSPAMMTGAGVLLGTAAYMSPEQAKGREADKRSDVWSFGAVLFTILPEGPIDNAQIAVLDLRDGTQKIVMQGGSDARYVEGGYLVYGVEGTLRAVAFDLDRLEVRGTPIPVLQQGERSRAVLFRFWPRGDGRRDSARDDVYSGHGSGRRQRFGFLFCDRRGTDVRRVA